LEKSIGPEIAKELISKDSSSHYGAKQEITVLFSDIRGFTALAEKTDMWSVQTLLNKYFEHMARAIGKHKGVINKYIGDAIFAIFNLFNLFGDNVLVFDEINCPVHQERMRFIFHNGIFEIVIYKING